MRAAQCVPSRPRKRTSRSATSRSRRPAPGCRPGRRGPPFRATSVQSSITPDGHAASPLALIALTTPPFLSAPEKTLKSESANRSPRSVELHAEAQVRLVGAVAVHRLVVGQRGEGRAISACPGPSKISPSRPSISVVDVVRRDERHLDVDLGELGLAVGAQVLVAEAAGDLEVAFDAGDHEQLLVLLRRLRQGVEAAGLHAGRARGSRARPPAWTSTGSGSRPR